MAIPLFDRYDMIIASALSVVVTFALVLLIEFIFVWIFKNKHQEMVNTKIKRLSLDITLSETPTETKILELIAENEKLRKELKSKWSLNLLSIILLFAFALTSKKNTDKLNN